MWFLTGWQFPGDKTYSGWEAYLLGMTTISTTVNILKFANDNNLNLRKLKQLGCLNEAVQGVILRYLERAAWTRQPWRTSDMEPGDYNATPIIFSLCFNCVLTLVFHSTEQSLPTCGGSGKLASSRLRVSKFGDLKKSENVCLPI